MSFAIVTSTTSKLEYRAIHCNRCGKIDVWNHDGHLCANGERRMTLDVDFGWITEAREFIADEHLEEGR